MRNSVVLALTALFGRSRAADYLIEKFLIIPQALLLEKHNSNMLGAVITNEKAYVKIVAIIKNLKVKRDPIWRTGQDHSFVLHIREYGEINCYVFDAATKSVRKKGEYEDIVYCLNQGDLEILNDILLNGQQNRNDTEVFLEKISSSDENGDHISVNTEFVSMREHVKDILTLLQGLMPSVIYNENSVSYTSSERINVYFGSGEQLIFCSFCRNKPLAVYHNNTKGTKFYSSTCSAYQKLDSYFLREDTDYSRLQTEYISAMITKTTRWHTRSMGFIGAEQLAVLGEIVEAIDHTSPIPTPFMLGFSKASVRLNTRDGFCFYHFFSNGMVCNDGNGLWYVCPSEMYIQLNQIMRGMES